MPVPDLELALAYYAEVVGLVEVVARRARPSAPTSRAGTSTSTTRSCSPGARPTGSTRWASRSSSRPISTSWQARVEAAGVAVTRHAPGELGPGSGDDRPVPGPERAHRRARARHGAGRQRMPLLNPPIGPDGLVGMHPPRIDHIFLMCEDVNGATDFFRDVLDFRMTEQILADDGYQLASFLERSHSTHDIAFLTGPDGGFHHVAFWVDDWNELRHARRHLRLSRHHRRCRADPPWRDTRLRPLLLRPGRQPQRALHRRLLVRPRRRTHHLDRVGDRPGDLLLPGQAQPGLHDGAFMTVHS